MGPRSCARRRGASIAQRYNRAVPSNTRAIEPFKNRIDPALVRMLATHLHSAWHAFPRERFVREACEGLDGLELKPRVRHVAAVLGEVLPAKFLAAADVIEATLRPIGPDAPLSELVAGDDGLAGWGIWPLTEFVAHRGLPHPARALACLRELTQRWTAEYAVRPFLVEHEALALATLHEWLGDPSHHVRRLVSEGSRPRLPWGMQLQRFIADPSPTLPLLRALQDDRSEYVRRSVANHLNDIAKDHPQVVAEWLAEHLPGAGKERSALLRHASRTLVKRGDRAVLAAFGVDRAFAGEVGFVVTPARAKVGGAVELVVGLRSSGKRAQRLVVDYTVQHVERAAGKVWKGWTVELAAGEERELRKRHSLRPVTTRRLYVGRHRVEVRINGRAVAAAEFVLV